MNVMDYNDAEKQDELTFFLLDVSNNCVECNSFDSALRVSVSNMYHRGLSNFLSRASYRVTNRRRKE